MKYIDADLLRKEIEKLKKENDNIKCDSNKAYCQGYGDAFVDLLPFLDTLSEEPDKSLEEAAIDFADNARKELFTKDYAISSIADYDHGCIDGFIAGAKWQAEQDNYDVIFWKGMQHAIEEMKKDAVEADVISNAYPTTIQFRTFDNRFHHGDKVRIIIVKED